MDTGKTVNIKEEGIHRGHEAAAFVTENDHETVDPTGGQHVEVLSPVLGIVKPLLEPAPLHRIGRNAPIDQARRFGHRFDGSEQWLVIGGPANPLRRIERGVHQANRVCSAKHEGGTSSVSNMANCQRLRSRRQRQIGFPHPGGHCRIASQTRHNHLSIIRLVNVIGNNHLDATVIDGLA